MGIPVPAPVLGWRVLSRDGESRPSARTRMGHPVLGWELSYWYLYWDEDPVLGRGVPYWDARSYSSTHAGMGIQFGNGVSCTGMGDPVMAAILG